MRSQPLTEGDLLNGNSQLEGLTELIVQNPGNHNFLWRFGMSRCYQRKYVHTGADVDGVDCVWCLLYKRQRACCHRTR